MRLGRIKATFAEQATACTRCTFTIQAWATHLLIAGDRVCDQCVTDDERERV